MAKIDSILGKVTGKIGPLVHYKLPGSDDTFIRTKPAVSKHALKKHPRYEKTRQQNMEFKGCVKAAKTIARALWPIKNLGDHNSSGPLVRICKYIQQADTTQPKGRRSVLFSQAGSLLNGFSFNNQNPFETLVRSPIHLSVDRVQGTVLLQIPTLRPGVQLFNPAKQPFYRFLCSLGIVSDLLIPANEPDYDFLHDEHSDYMVGETEWYKREDPFPATELVLQYPFWIDKPGLTLIAGIGIGFGRQSAGGSIETVKYAGAGKIWMTV